MKGKDRRDLARDAAFETFVGKLALNTDRELFAACDLDVLRSAFEAGWAATAVGPAAPATNRRVAGTPPRLICPSCGNHYATKAHKEACRPKASRSQAQPPSASAAETGTE